VFGCLDKEKGRRVFQGWDNYFAMLGTAAGSLIGLLFVVVTLTSNFERSQALRGASVYMTPTAAHFAVALAICCVTLAPGLSRSWAAALLGLTIAAGLANALRAAVGIRRYESEIDHHVHWSDFWWYGVTPAAVYVGLAVSVAALWLGFGKAVYGLAVASLLLLLVAIHNAWDLVTWMAPQGTASPTDLTPPPEPPR
jgi:hypothetical protein